MLSNNRSAGVLAIAKTHQIPIAICNKVTLQKEEEIMPLLHQFHIDFIALFYRGVIACRQITSSLHVWSCMGSFAVLEIDTAVPS